MVIWPPAGAPEATNEGGMEPPTTNRETRRDVEALRSMAGGIPPVSRTGSSRDILLSRSAGDSYPPTDCQAAHGCWWRVAWPHSSVERKLMLGTVLVILLVLMLLGALPTWPHSRNWGYGPSGGLGLVLVILIVYSC